MKIDVKPIRADETVKRLGLEPGGRVQQLHTLNVARRIKRYLPKRNYDSVTQALDRGVNAKGGRISVTLPYAKYLYYGKAMAGTPRKPTKKDLVYTTEQNVLAGPFWDGRLKQNEIHEIEAELKACIEGKQVK